MNDKTIVDGRYNEHKLEIKNTVQTLSIPKIHYLILFSFFTTYLLKIQSQSKKIKNNRM